MLSREPAPDQPQRVTTNFSPRQGELVEPGVKLSTPEPLTDQQKQEALAAFVLGTQVDDEDQIFRGIN